MKLQSYRLTFISLYCHNLESHDGRQLPFLNLPKEKNDHTKYFMINLHEKMLPTPWKSNLQYPDHQSDAHPTEPPRPAAYKGSQLMISKRHADVNVNVNFNVNLRSVIYFDPYPDPRYSNTKLKV